MNLENVWEKQYPRYNAFKYLHKYRFWLTEFKMNGMVLGLFYFWRVRNEILQKMRINFAQFVRLPSTVTTWKCRPLFRCGVLLKSVGKSHFGLKPFNDGLLGRRPTSTSKIFEGNLLNAIFLGGEIYFDRRCTYDGIAYFVTNIALCNR